MLSPAGSGSNRRRPPNAGKGRRAGVPNKTTAALKDAILKAFDTVGGEAYLVRVAKTDPRTFCALLAKVLPQEMRAEVIGANGGPIIVQTGVPQAP